MLIYIKFVDTRSNEAALTVKAFRLEDVVCVNAPIKNSDENYCYTLEVKYGNNGSLLLCSKEYSSQKEAEMAQLSTITILNALELYYGRVKHIERDTPLFFKTVDPKKGEIVTGQISYNTMPVYTIEL